MIDFLFCFVVKDAVSFAKSSIWAPGGTGSRIFGDNAANKAANKAAVGRGGAKNVQDKLASLQQKQQNKNLSNKKRKELKKQERKIRSDEKKRSVKGGNGVHNQDDTDLVIANVQTLTI